MTLPPAMIKTARSQPQYVRTIQEAKAQGQRVVVQLGTGKDIGKPGLEALKDPQTSYVLIGAKPRMTQVATTLPNLVHFEAPYHEAGKELVGGPLMDELHLLGAYSPDVAVRHQLELYREHIEGCGNDFEALLARVPGLVTESDVSQLIGQVSHRIMAVTRVLEFADGFNELFSRFCHYVTVRVYLARGHKNNGNSLSLTNAFPDVDGQTKIHQFEIKKDAIEDPQHKPSKKWDAIVGLFGRPLTGIFPFAYAPRCNWFSEYYTVIEVSGYKMAAV